VGVLVFRLPRIDRRRASRVIWSRSSAAKTGFRCTVPRSLWTCMSRRAARNRWGRITFSVRLRRRLPGAVPVPRLTLPLAAFVTLHAAFIALLMVYAPSPW